MSPTLDYQSPRSDPAQPGDFAYPRKVAIGSALVAVIAVLLPFLFFLFVSVFFPNSESAAFALLIPTAVLWVLSGIASLIAMISGIIAFRRGATGQLIYPATIIGGVILTGFALVLALALFK